MNHLIPDKYKINIMVLIIASVYLAMSLNEFMVNQKNLSIEEYIEPLGGDLAKNGSELSRLYIQVQKDALALPQTHQNEITNITLKYNVITWVVIGFFSYLASCLIIYRIDKDKYGKT